MKVTIEQIRDMQPCYDPTRYMPEKWEGTLTEMLSFQAPEEDLIFVACGLINTKQQREFARWCAIQVVHLWDVPDVSLEYLKTGIEELRKEARSAAWAVNVSAWDVDSTVRTARNDSASAAVCATRDDSASAARAAAVAATRAASGDCFLKKAIDKIKTYEN
tara:strand:+ start:497 stop:982 length:486 start_codon:yes stop_codon:yes gene_type:complete